MLHAEPAASAPVISSAKSDHRSPLRRAFLRSRANPPRSSHRLCRTDFAAPTSAVAVGTRLTQFHDSCSPGGDADGEPPADNPPPSSKTRSPCSSPQGRSKIEAGQPRHPKRQRGTNRSLTFASSLTLRVTIELVPVGLLPSETLNGPARHPREVELDAQTCHNRLYGPRDGGLLFMAVCCSSRSGKLSSRLTVGVPC